MVLIKLKVRGGLGNQLSQISFAYGILKKYKNASLIVDKSLYKRKIKRSIKFGKLKHKTNTFKFFLDELPISKIYSYPNKLSFNEKFVFYIHDLILIFLKFFELSTRTIGINMKENKLIKKFFLILSRVGLYTDDNRSFLEFNKSLIPIITISGYFQDINYHLNNKEKMRELLLKKPDSNEELFSQNLDSNLNNVSFLLRLNNDRALMTDVENFLDKSISIINNMNQDFNKIFFSDNQSKLIRNSNNYKNSIFCLIKDPLTQLYLAANAGIFVISESSFAWWAYFLSNKESKVVIKPTRWVLDSPYWNPGFDLKDKIYDINVNYLKTKI